MSDFNDFVSLDLGKMNDDESRYDKRAAGKRINRLRVSVDEPRVIRILRGPSDPSFYSVRAQHWNIPVGHDGPNRPYSCAKKHVNEPCYFCEAVNGLYNSGDPTDKVYGSKTKVSVNVIMNVLDVNSPVNDDGTPKVLLWQPSWRLFQDVRAYFRDPDYGDLTHPVTGRNFKVTCNMDASNQWKRFDIKVGARETELETPEALDHLYPLEETLPIKIYSYEEQRMIWDGTWDPRGDNALPASASSVAPKLDAPSEEASAEEEFEVSKTPSDVVGEAGSAHDDDDGWDDLASDDSASEKQMDMMKKLEALKKAAKK